MSNIAETVQKLKEESKLPEPNPDCSWEELQNQLEDDLYLIGQAFVWGIPNTLGTSAEYHRLLPAAVQFIQAKNITTGEVTEEFRVVGFKGYKHVTIPVDEMIRFSN